MSYIVSVISSIHSRSDMIDYIYIYYTNISVCIQVLIVYTLFHKHNAYALAICSLQFYRLSIIQFHTTE